MLYHPDADTANLHQRGCGKIAVSAAGDLTSHTLTADRYMVMNKLKNTSGTNLTCTLLVNIIMEQ